MVFVFIHKVRLLSVNLCGSDNDGFKFKQISLYGDEIWFLTFLIVLELFFFFFDN